MTTVLIAIAIAVGVFALLAVALVVGMNLASRTPADDDLFECDCDNQAEPHHPTVHCPP